MYYELYIDVLFLVYDGFPFAFVCEPGAEMSYHTWMHLSGRSAGGRTDMCCDSGADAGCHKINYIPRGYQYIHD